MKIHFIVNRSKDRLKWQYEMSQFKGQLDFNIGVAVQNIENLNKEVLEPEDTVVLIIDQLEQIEGLGKLKGFVSSSNHILVVISSNLENALGKVAVIDKLEVMKLYLNAYLFESECTKEKLYQSLFKPEKLKFERHHTYLGSGISNSEMETVKIDEEVYRSKHSFLDFKSKRKDRIVKEAKGIEKLPRQKICIHGQSALAYEIGAVLSTAYNQSVIILDLDRTMPTADIYCGVKPVVTEKYDFYSKVTATGLNILLDCMKKKELGREAFQLCTQKVKGFNELQVLTGVYKMEDFEYYKADEIRRLIHSASQYYDVVILKTNSFPYDGFTLSSFIQADLILAGMSPAIEALRNHRQLIQLMASKQGVPASKQYWVLFENSKISASEKHFLMEMGLGTYCGSVPFEQSREKCSRIGEGYLHQQRHRLQEIYRPIIKNLYGGGVS